MFPLFQVKISDFGLARSLEGEAIKVVSLRTKLALAWYVHLYAIGVLNPFYLVFTSEKKERHFSTSSLASQGNNI